MNFIRKNGLGILLSIAVMLLAMLLSQVLPKLGTALLALLLGIIIRLFIPQIGKFESGIKFSEKYILETAIVFIGFGFQVKQLVAIGSGTIGILVLSITLVVVFALLLKKLFKDQSNLFLLIGTGTAICGSAAIGATAPILKNKEEETGIALTVINVLGLLGMVLLPLIGSAFHFSNVDLGIFLGGILQSMGHVVGSAFSMGTEIGEIATIVKMGRISLLIPYLIIIYFVFNKSASGAKLSFPKFILFFIIAASLAQFDLFSESQLKTLSKFGDILLNIAMAAIGLKINLKILFKISGKAFIIGALVFILQICIFIIYLLMK